MSGAVEVYASEGGAWSLQKVFDGSGGLAEARALADELTRGRTIERAMVVERDGDGSSDGTGFQVRYKVGARDTAFSVGPAGEAREPIVLGVQKGLTGEWIVVGPRFAKRHKLYGVYGWLMYFAYVLAVGPVYDAWQFVAGDEAAGASMPALVLIVGLTFALNWFPLFLLRRRRPSFPTWVAWIHAFVLLMSALALDVIGAGRCALVIGYILLSKRVNVTFKHRVRREDLQWIIADRQLASARFVPARALARQEA